MTALPQHDAPTTLGDIQQDLADLVWKHFADEIREAMNEAAEALSDEKIKSRRA